MTLALDSNMIIHLIHGTESVRMEYRNTHLQGISIMIPPYVDYEICKGLYYVKASAKLRSYQNICRICDIGEMNRNIWRCAANLYSDLRRKGFMVSDADILIAAFCMENGCTLVTNNTKDFANIEGLTLTDWLIL